MCVTLLPCSVASRVPGLWSDTCPLAPPAQSASTPKALLVRNRFCRAEAAARRQGDVHARITHGGDDTSVGALKAVNAYTILYAPGMEARTPRRAPAPF